MKEFNDSGIQSGRTNQLTSEGRIHREYAKALSTVEQEQYYIIEGEDVARIKAVIACLYTESNSISRRDLAQFLDSRATYIIGPYTIDDLKRGL